MLRCDKESSLFYDIVFLRPVRDLCKQEKSVVYRYKA